MKAQLKAGLASLPAPSNDFEIVLPEVRLRMYICIQCDHDMTAACIPCTNWYAQNQNLLNVPNFIF